MLKLDEIKTAKDFREEVVSVPEWGGEVRVRTLSMGARYEISTISEKAGGVDTLKFAASTMAHGVSDPVMTYDQALEVIKTRAPEPIQRIIDAVWAVSGIAEATIKNG